MSDRTQVGQCSLSASLGAGLEDALQTSEYDKGLSLVVIVDDTELDFAFPFFDRRGNRELCSGNTCGFSALAT